MDVWLLFGLVLPFISFILSIMEELVKDDGEDMKVQNIIGFFFFPKIVAWSNLGNLLTQQNFLVQ